MINDSRPFGSILDSPLLRAFASFLLATEGWGGGWYSRSTGRSRVGGGGLLGTAVWTGIWDKNNENLFPFSSSFLETRTFPFSGERSFLLLELLEVYSFRRGESQGVREGLKIFLIAREEENGSVEGGRLEFCVFETLVSIFIFFVRG